MLTVRESEHFERGKLLRSWGRSSSLFVESEAIENRFNVEVDGIPYDSKFIFAEPGYNIEPSEMGAAFGVVQLNKLDHNINEREKNFAEMSEFFKQYEEYFVLPKQLPNSRTGWLALALTIRDSAPFKRTEMQIFLEKRNIQTRTVFTGNILRQPGFKNVECKRSSDGYAESDKVMRGGMLLACHHGLTREMIDYTKENISAFMASI